MAQFWALQTTMPELLVLDVLLELEAWPLLVLDAPPSVPELLLVLDAPPVPLPPCPVVPPPAPSPMPGLPFAQAARASVAKRTPILFMQNPMPLPVARHWVVGVTTTVLIGATPAPAG